MRLRSPFTRPLLVTLCLLTLVGEPRLVLAALPPPASPPGVPGPVAVPAQHEASPLPLGLDDPVDFHRGLLNLDGALALRFQDVAIPARGRALELGRVWRSDLDRATELGWGWAWTWSVRLELEPTSAEPRVLEADGAITRYESTSPEVFRAVSGRIGSALHLLADESWMRVAANGERERFDRQGRLVAVYDAHGLALTVERREGRPQRIVDTAGRALTFEVDDVGLLRRVVDPIGRAWTFAYEAGRLVGTTDPLERTTTYAYDQHGRLVGVEFVDGGALEVGWDPLGRVSQIAGPGPLRTAVRTERSFDGTTVTQELVDACGHATRVEAQRIDGCVTARITNGASEVAQVEVRPGKISLSAGGGPPTSIELGPDGTPIAVVDGEGRDLLGGSELPTVWRDDAVGADEESVVREDEAPTDEPDIDTTPVEPPSVQELFDERGYPRVIDTPGERLRATYDDGGRLLALTRSDGTVVERYTWDAGDRLIAHVDRLGREEAVTHDAGDREVRRVDFRGNATTTTWDPRGLPLRRDDPRGFSTTFEYDAAGRLLRAAEGERSLAFTWDAANRLVRVEDHRGLRVELELDAFGRQVGLRLPRGERVRVEPDATGTTVWGSINGGPTAFVRSLGGDGLTLSRTSGQSERWARDDSGAVWNVKRSALGRSALRARLSDGRVLFDGVPGLEPLSRQWDALGRLVSEGRGTRRTRWRWTEQGVLAGRTDPDGTDWACTCDEQGRVVSERSSRGERRSYEYDDHGDVVAVTDSFGRRADYRRDSFGRVVEVREGAAVTRWSYDAYDRVTAVVGPGESVATYAYDAQGALIEEVKDGLTTKYTYDRFGALSRVERPGADVETFTCDERGRLVEHVGHGIVERFEYDADGRLTAHERGSVRLSFSRDPDGRLTGVDGARRATLDYGLADAPVGWTDERGGTWREERNAFGEVVRRVDPEGGITKFERTPSGALARVVDPAGRALRFVRDGSGRLVEAGPEVVTEVEVEVDGRTDRAVSFFRLRDGQLGELREFWPDPFPVPDWRRGWSLPPDPPGPRRS